MPGGLPKELPPGLGGAGGLPNLPGLGKPVLPGLGGFPGLGKKK
jgi:signal recognition particle subunit SRP54